ncbi:cellulose binding domain-containing protein [Pseudoalteromonas luteoviolacea]|uniref:cellulose binding domain-containing protein n=1 Tax=Pseudoalteromonas luteoviolacea TaxID=43657 RepID=UPI001EEEBD43|nr:cellulose binding domain-containing protein [Pseudoalteromonas luteoviolacea]MCF6442979.1 cellulose binding domain-containing protein [Pseudoalteromonas luteoviolacea]
MRQHRYNSKQHRFLKIGLCLMVLGHPIHSLAAQCEFNVKNEWQSGYTAEVTVFNNTDSVINGWEVGLAFNQGESINNAWRAQLSGNSPYQFSNLNWNSTIQPGSSKAFGFNVKKSNGQAVTTPRLFGICEGGSQNNDVTVVASASNNQGTAPATINFTSEATNLPSDNVSYHWDFGNGQTSNEINPQHIFDQAGAYSVLLTIKDGTNNYPAAPIAVTISEAQPESAQCTFEVEQEWISGFRGKVTITNTESVAISNWKVLMAFSDNTKLTGVWHARHSGNNPYEIINENYNSTINPGQSLDFGFNAQKAQENDTPAIPSLGGLCSLDGDINHAPLAVASASTTSGDYPLTINFKGDESSDLDGDALTFSWDFGNGQTSSEPNPTYIYEEEGTFSVTLTVNDGVISTVSDPVTIQVSEPEAPPISAPFILDPQSSHLYFVSTKKQHLVESHTFNNISGSITPEGVARLAIDLSSVDTANDTRDGRMKEFLFDTESFPTAEALLAIDYAALVALPIGSTEMQSISTTLNLTGVIKEVNADVVIRRLANNKIMVQTLTPIVLDATDFGLESGIETLRTLANLSVISYAVPVSFNLVFEAQQ